MKTSTVIIITLSIASIPFGFYLLQFSDMPFSNNTTHWAEFGDYIGGLLNPILSAAAFILLLKTISQNEKSLRQNDKALKQTAEELTLTRIELKNAAQAQILQAEIDRINQEDRKNNEAKVNYSTHIKNIYDELLEFSNRKFMRLASNNLLVSINCISERRLNDQHDNIIHYSDRYSDEFNYTMNGFLTKADSFILQIKSATHLEGHPNKDTEIQYQLLRNYTFILNHLNTLSDLVLKILTKEKEIKIVSYKTLDNTASQLITDIRSNIFDSLLLD
jgi:large-conductance mechanosensitive channel